MDIVILSIWNMKYFKIVCSSSFLLFVCGIWTSVIDNLNVVN